MNKTHDTNVTRSDAYQRVTDRMVAALEAGTVPWLKPWRSRFGGALPQNMVSRKDYNGINRFLLSLSDFEDPRWLSYRQAQALGGNVRKGEKGEMIVFFKELEFDADTARDGIAKKIPFLSYSTVFNIAQCDGIDAPSLPGLEPDGPVLAPTVDASGIYEAMPARPVLKHGFTRACYSPKPDTVMMPRLESFTTGDGYYRVLFHELAHATGHESRLNRPGFGADGASIAAFGDPVYSKEELIAEMAAAMVADAAGVPLDVPNSAAYLAGWLSVLKSDKRLVVSAAGAAQKAANWILGVGA